MICCCAILGRSRKEEDGITERHSIMTRYVDYASLSRVVDQCKNRKRHPIPLYTIRLLPGAEIVSECVFGAVPFSH